MLPLEALRESLSAWRKSRNPRFAATAQWATARALEGGPRPLVGAGKKQADVAAWRELLGEDDPLDVPRLLAAVGKGTSTESVERITLLSKLDDPRVTQGLLELLGAPPYRARTAIGFFRACAKALLESGDPRVRPALEELAARYKSILETSVGDDVAALLLRTATSIDQVKPGPLTPALEQKCVALELVFETERTLVQRGAVKQRSAQHNDDALLAAIYAAPDDDTPRLVLADALTERGDERGEFIALQLNRAKGKTTPAQLVRERALSVDPKRRVAWGLPLSQGATCHLARGFPDELGLEPRMFKTIVGNPALRTVNEVTGLERNVSLKQAKAFLFHEAVARVTSVSTLTQELLESFDAPLPWRSLGLNFIPTAEHRAHLANVRELTLRSWGPTVPANTFAGMERLEKVVLGTPDPGALEPLLGLISLDASHPLQNFHWARELEGLEKLRDLELGSTCSAAQLEGLKLTSLTVQVSPELDVDGLLQALPALEELTVSCRDDGAPTVTAVGKLIKTKRLTQLRRATVGSYEFTSPGTPEGKLELRAWNRMNYERHAAVIALLAPGFVGKVWLLPRAKDPWTPAGPPPSEEAIQAIRAAAKVPLELAWY